MIRVTPLRESGEPILINAEEIEIVRPLADGSAIFLKSGNVYRVSESLDEIERKFLTYKQAIFREMYVKLNTEQ